MAHVNVTEPIGVLFEHLEKMLSAKTVFGEPMSIGDITLIPVVDITFGAGTGAGSGLEKNERNEGAVGGGAGARVTASAVIMIRDSQVQVLNLKHAVAMDRILDMVPDLLKSLKIGKPTTPKDAETTA